LTRLSKKVTALVQRLEQSRNNLRSGGMTLSSHLAWRVSRYGDEGQVARVVRKLSKKDTSKLSAVVEQPERCTVPVPASVAKTIHWVMPDFEPGSGGHTTIFRYIQWLERAGYTCNVVIVGPHWHRSTEDCEASIRAHFFPIAAKVRFGIDGLGPARFCFATGWKSAYSVRAFGNARHKLYFVQDFESMFYPAGSEASFADATYGFGFVGVTAGSWLSDRLGREYAMRCLPLGFSYDRDLYQPKPRLDPEVTRIFCYCRPSTPRRGLELSLMALNLVGHRHPGIEFVFAGADMKHYKFDHPVHNAGVLPVRELAELYAQCDIGLVLSFTNVSLVPLELMACGCAVVSNTGPYVEWLLNRDVSALAEPTPDSIANAIGYLIDNPDERRALQARARAFAASTSWEGEARKLDRFLAGLDSPDASLSP
jgi:O-antigen biosynthesis protein